MSTMAGVPNALPVAGVPLISPNLYKVNILLPVLQMVKLWL